MQLVTQATRYSDDDPVDVRTADIGSVPDGIIIVTRW